MKLIKPGKGAVDFSEGDFNKEVERLKSKRQGNLQSDREPRKTSREESQHFNELDDHSQSLDPVQSLNSKKTSSNGSGRKARLNKTSKSRQRKPLKNQGGRKDKSVQSADEPLGGVNAGNKKEYDFLMHRAIHYLSMREHSVLELERKLNTKTEDVDVVHSVMEFLLDNDYVSDARFAEAYVRFKGNKGQGPIKIRAELRNKGVSAVIIDEHLSASDSVWFDNALSLHNKKYGEAPVKDYNEWSKRARFMQSRGFSMDHIQCAVPQVDSSV